jgi:DNA-binding MarR family transcriptional regulator
MIMQPAIPDLAVDLQAAISLVVRRLKAHRLPGELSAPEQTALSRLQREGPVTAADLARLERISPQSMGATLAALEQQGLLSRSKDPQDGRRILLAVTDQGRSYVESKRSARAEQLAAALTQALTPDELAQVAAVVPLLDRIAAAL